MTNEQRSGQRVMHCEFLMIVCHNGKKTFIIACRSKQNLLGLWLPIYLAPCRYVDLTQNVKSGERCGYVQTGDVTKWYEGIELRKKRRKNECAWTFLGRFTSGAHLYCTRELTLPHALFAVAVYTYIIILTLIHSLQQILQLQLLQLTLRWNITWC